MRDDREIITKMIEHSTKVINYCKGMSYDNFSENEMLIEACVFNLSQVGEYSHKISNELISSHTEIAWNELYGLRNHIVHNYEGVNCKLVWEIISNDLPELIEQLNSML